MMKIEHLAIWVTDLEKMKTFYEKYFKMTAADKYENAVKRFQSYFLSFGSPDAARIELMQRPEVFAMQAERGMKLGYAHMAISVGSKMEVDNITQRLREDGYCIIGEPRTTGDGYYESVIEDCEGNWVEITE